MGDEVNVALETFGNFNLPTMINIAELSAGNWILSFLPLQAIFIVCSGRNMETSEI